MTVVAVEPDPTGFRLADGAPVRIDEWLDTELRASFEINANPRETSWRPFSTTRGMTLQDSGRVATLADTNLQLANCLPRFWEFCVFGWRASIEAPHDVISSDELAAWTAATSCTLQYQDKTQCDATLSDLRKALLLDSLGVDGYVKSAEIPRVPLVGSMLLPIYIRHGYQYGVRVDTHADMSRLRRLLSKYQACVLTRISLRGFLKRCIV